MSKMAVWPSYDHFCSQMFSGRNSYAYQTHQYFIIRTLSINTISPYVAAQASALPDNRIDTLGNTLLAIMESSTGNGENKEESKAQQQEDLLPYSGMTESPKTGEVKETSIPSSVQTNMIQKQISDLMTDSMRKEGGINEGDQQDSAGAQTGTAPFSKRAEATERPLPERTASGSFRFYSDEGVVAPDDGAHTQMFSQRSAAVAADEKEKEHAADLALPPATSSESNFANSQDDDNISITNSVVNKPKRGMDNRVSSRLILAQSTDMVPVNHSRGSEVTSKVKGFETMKLHLSTIVRAAETHLQATMELKKVQQMVSCFGNETKDEPAS